MTTHDGQLVFVLDLSRFEKLAESFDAGLQQHAEAASKEAK